jgi:nucleotide-binding universal stress UspA family protein
MYRTVVVPLDRTTEADAAVGYGATLARQAGAALELLTVPSTYMDSTDVENHLADAAARHDVEAKLSVTETGDVTETILATADAADTLLCMRTHARGTLTEMALGSVSEAVVRGCHQPVLLVGPHCGPAPERFASMVVGLDGSKLAEQILPVAVDWSTQLGVTPWLFQVLAAHMPLEAGGEDYQDTGYVHRMADRLKRDNVSAEWDAAHDRHPAAAIARFAEGVQPAVVALTTHGRTGLSRLALGSVALEVAHRATAPVLVLRPDEGES